jgi:xanthine dehydrogenase accessory factor
MLDKFLENIQKLIKKNELFALATVVRRDAPSSGKIGDKAIINKYGEIIGWVGGGCVRGIIIKEAEDIMRTGTAKLVKIGKSLNNIKQEGVVEYKMTCQSEGTVEVFIEPIIPKPHIIIIGKTEIAKSLSKLAHYAGYRITGVAHDANLQTFEKVDELITHVSLKDVKTSSETYIIVCTQGEGDEAALIEGLSKERAILGFVTSRKKWVSVTENLIALGNEKKNVESIIAPIGIDINAKKPDEVAISILAEMIQHKNSSDNQSAFQKFETNLAPGASKPVYYTNPVCGVPVDMNNPKHIVEYKGEKVYFCCDGCKVKFDAEPEKYIK